MLLRPMCLAVHNTERALLAEGVARAEVVVNLEDWLPNHMITVSIAQQGKSERQLRAIATYLSRNMTVRILQRDDQGRMYLLFTALIVNISSNRSGIPLKYTIKREIVYDLTRQPRSQKAPKTSGKAEKFPEWEPEDIIEEDTFSLKRTKLFPRNERTENGPDWKKEFHEHTTNFTTVMSRCLIATIGHEKA